jgi:hypothetical protein
MIEIGKGGQRPAKSIKKLESKARKALKKPKS